MGKGDHIVIPKTILKNFSNNDNKKVTIYNLNTKEKKENFPDNIYVEKDYYEDDIDEYIKAKDETSIGNLYASIKKKKINYKDIKNMKNIFIIQHYRNKSFSKNMSTNKLFNRIFHNIELKLVINQYLKNNEIQNTYIDEFHKDIYEYIESLYSSFIPGCLILNKTQRTLILPSSQFAYIKLLNTDSYLYPIAPDIALTWRKTDFKKDFDYLETTDNQAINKVNQLICECELKDKGDNIIYGLRNEIDKVIENLN